MNVSNPSKSAKISEKSTNYGVSIGTVEAQLYSESGLNFDNFGNANYVAKTSDGTYMGFNVSGNYGYDEKGDYVWTPTTITLVAINSTEDAVTIPDSLKIGNADYPVTRINSYSDFVNGLQNGVKILTIPSTVTYIYNYSDISSYLDEIYMLGAAPTIGYTSLKVIKVLVCCKNDYSSYLDNSYYSDCSVLPYGWDFEWMTVNVARRGEFAQTYIEMTDANWELGRYVKITGILNSTDLQNINNLTYLIKLDLREADFTNLPNNFLENKSSLSEIYFPDDLTSIPQSAFRYCYSLSSVFAPGVTSIGNEAFYNCRNLSKFDLSKVRKINKNAFYDCTQFNPTDLSSVSSIGSSAFYNTAVKEVIIPEGVSSISSFAFSNCTQLSKVTLPMTISSISNNAFYQCTALTSINLPEGITSIGYEAFNNCNRLSEITFPSTLQSIGSDILDGCSSLLSVKCKAILPPVSDGDFTYGVDLNHCTLYVAPFAIDAYRATADWSNFYIMKPLNEPVKNIYINRPMTFDLLSEDNAVLQENPNMTLDYSYDNVGQLTATGDGTLSAGIFSIFHKFVRRYDANYNDYRTTLVNDAENMRADSVVSTIDFEKNRWHFISFQYDIKMEDISGVNNTDFVIRQYNSENRASGDASISNWEDVPADGVLKAGKGYIIQAANNSTDESWNNTTSAAVRFPSRNTVTKNNLFTSKNVIVPLEEYPAEFAHNRSWNLVGNPYPCYYDMHYLKDDFVSPIVLWRGTNYQAYSPIDDDIILRPNEAFFVQRPLDLGEMVFGSEGRMHYNEAYNANSKPGIYGMPSPSGFISDRAVFNFNIQGCGTDDRARIVINDDALMDYELNRDASKFFSETLEGAEIYVVDNVKYDICERPLADGIANLGVNIGTEGTYTISLSGRNIDEWNVILTDKVTGVTVDLDNEPYLFEAKPETIEGRFSLRFKAPVPSVIEKVEIPDDAVVRVFNMSGVNVFEGKMNDFKVSASSGIYIATYGEKSYKIVVR